MRGTKLVWAFLVLVFIGLSMITDFNAELQLRGGTAPVFGDQRNDDAPLSYWLLPADKARKPSTGTAFSIADELWLTARHVVDQCDSVWAVLPGRGKKKVKKVSSISLHPSADIALLDLSLQTPHAPLLTGQNSPGRRSSGYHFGFPGGSPGDVLSSYLGESRASVGRRGKGAFPVHVWAASEIPRGLSSLGGLSGGPAFDREGRILGVTIAEDRRRGRVATTDPLLSAAIVELAGATTRLIQGEPTAEPVQGLTDKTYHDKGDTLRANQSVVQIYCHVRTSGKKTRFDTL